MSNLTCCFTGHRKLSKDKIDQLIINLDREIEHLINQGGTAFISGGALGFDQIAASLIIAKRKWTIKFIPSSPYHAKVRRHFGRQRNSGCIPIDLPKRIRLFVSRRNTRAAVSASAAA